MLAKIEFLIRTYMWASSDKNSRGSKPEIDIPSYMIKINDSSVESLNDSDIENAYAWIYGDDFDIPSSNYN